MRIIVGLGNPGPEYQWTRHNVGFRIVEQLSERWGGRLARQAFLSKVDEVWRDGEKLMLVQPQTYMNRSGEAVARIRDFYHLEPSDIIVIHDDLDLPLAQVRIKRGGGGAGGNRGVASIIEELGGKDFVRVKFGIGRPVGKLDPAEFVLQPFTPLEEAFILPAMTKVVAGVEVLLKEGVERAMALCNVSDREAATESETQREKPEIQ